MSEVAAYTVLPRVVHLVDSGGFEVAISGGTRDGLKLGQRFLVFAYGPEATDPGSGENLGRIELVRGRGEVVHLQDNMAIIRPVEKRPERARKRVIRETTPLGLALGRGHIVEEDLSDEEPLPFRQIAVGDLAKPI